MNPDGSGLLPGGNSPDWLTFNSNSSSVTFEVPQVDGRSLKTIMCIAYTSSPNNTTTVGFEVLLVINCTKNTIQVYKIGALLASFDEDEWQRVISNIEPGNEIKVVVVFTNEFIVKKTTIYLVYDKPNEEKTNHCHRTDENGIVSSRNENIFGRLFFAIPSLARTVLTSRPFWFCLAGIMVLSSRHRSEKRRRDNHILREVASMSSQGFNNPESLDRSYVDEEDGKQEEKEETSKDKDQREREENLKREMFPLNSNLS
ncbi:TMV resistance protein N-like [Trifolium medium]|uniref:TMV resistance protein N-like n=1 Tax=Trifolium medium TaxID=97028 RepID=A0A392LXN4_9FABA|nr:TMV resistance protein N-like [Trifolium medium]